MLLSYELGIGCASSNPLKIRLRRFGSGLSMRSADKNLDVKEFKKKPYLSI